MIEPFEVGVLLALGEGVADQTAVARRSAKELEAVLSSGGISVEVLRRIASQAMAPTRGVSSNRQSGDLLSDVRAPVTGYEPSGVSAKFDKDPSTSPVARTAAEPLLASRAISTNLRTDITKQEDGSVGRLAAPATVLPPAAAMSTTKEQTEPLSLASPQGGRMATILVYGNASLPQVIAPAAISPAESNFSVPVSMTAPGAQVRNEVVESPPPSRNPWLSEMPTASFPSAEQATERSIEPPRAPLRPARLDETMRVTAPSTVTGGVAKPQHAPPDRAGLVAGNNEDRPPHETESVQNTMRIQGDVFLDGALVGRWMSRRMNREAERASVGSTGFDASRGRLLPGPTVGGQ